MLLLPVLVAPNVGVVPEIALLKASLKVIVIVEVADPSATTGPVPEIEEVATAAAPAMKVTVLPDLVTGFVILKVFTSALVEVNVQTETPLTSLIEQAS